MINIYCISNTCDTHKCGEIDAYSYEEAYEVLKERYPHEEEDYAGYGVIHRDGKNFWRYELG